MTTRTCLIIVASLVNEKELHAQDLGVPGVYLVEGIDPRQSDEMVCETALESFHNREAIKVLEDFAIHVIDADSRLELEPAAQAVDSVEVLDCAKLGDDVPDWISSILQPPKPAVETRLSYSAHEPW